MSFAIDGTFLVPGAVGGAEHMLRNLVAGFSAIPGGGDFVVYGDPALASGMGLAADRVRSVRGPNRFVQSFRVLREAEGEHRAILYPNYFAPPRRRRDRIDVVTVIHDLFYRHHPSALSRRKRVWLRLAHESTLRSSDRVVAISDFTRQDILRSYGRKWEDKVVTIPNPISWDRFESSPPTAGDSGLVLGGPRSGPVILTLAAHYDHKNLTTLVRAFRRLRASAGFERATLVLIGQLRRNLAGIRQGTSGDISKEQADGVRVLGYAEDATIAAAFRVADVFAFPSLFEGFGMPAVEALGLGVPVITTRCASLPEVTLGLARYVDDPRSVEEWADVLRDTVERPSAWRPASDAIRRVRQTYAPSRIAQRYLEVLGADGS